MAYIRRYYGVPAKRGGRVEYIGNVGEKIRGTITGTRGARLRIKLDGEKKSRLYHPTCKITYLDNDDADKCQPSHKWVEIDDQSNGITRVAVKCTVCGIFGEKREDNGEIFWPAT